MLSDLIADTRDETDAVVFTRAPTMEEIKALLGPIEREMWDILDRANEMMSPADVQKLVREVQTGTHPARFVLIPILEAVVEDLRRDAMRSRAA